VCVCVCVCVGGGGTVVGVGRVKEGDYSDGIWLMDFTYLCETELRNLLQLLYVERGGG
jgi:hypothetical protein